MSALTTAEFSAKWSSARLMNGAMQSYSTTIWKEFIADLLESVGAGITTINASATLDFPSTVAGAVSDLTIACVGAAVGDAVILGAPAVPQSGTFFAWVSATDVVTVRYANNDLVTARDPASGTFKVTVIQVIS